MKLLIILIVCAVVFAADVQEENGVLVLTDENFDEVLKSKKLVLVEFYAPWCGHCKALAPEYEKAAKMLAARDTLLTGILAKVDSTVAKKVSEKYGIRGYPTLKLFREGEEAGEYDRGRTAGDIAEFMAERMDPNYKPPPPAVVTLTGANFSDFMAKNDYFLVEFFAPWCGHCKQLAPAYENAAKRLKEEDPPIPLAAVDATQDSELATKYGVNGYPTLKLMRKGEPSDYKGPRNEDGIIEYMIKNQRDAFTAVESMKELKKLIPETRPLILGYFPTPSQVPLRQIMIDATNELREDFISAITQSSEVAKEFGLTGPAVIMIHPERFQSKHEPKFHKFEGTVETVENLKKFINDNQFPLVGHLNWETSKYYDAIANESFCTIFFSVDFSFEHRAGTQLWRSKLLEVAKHFKGSVVFAIANDEDFQDRMQAFNFLETGVDMNIGCLKRRLRYLMPEMDEYDEDHIMSFIKKMEAGEMKPFLKSQPIPKKQTTPVPSVVGNNYEEMVFDMSKDVLIEYYSPNCGHCTQFAPTYDKLAARLGHIKSLKILKMNAKDNDVPPPAEISFFPTIRFRSSGSKELINFEGQRSVESLIDFMATNAIASKSELEAEVQIDKVTKKSSKEPQKETEKKDEL